jgi:hypothetical protein
MRGPNTEFQEWAIFVQERCYSIASREAAQPVLPIVSISAAALANSFLLLEEFVGDFAKCGQGVVLVSGYLQEESNVRQRSSMPC